MQNSGLMTYTAINSLIYLTKLVSGGRWLPPDFDMAEYWTWNPSNGRAPWFMRAARNGGRFWDHEPPTDDDREKSDDDINEDGHRRSDSQAGLKGNAAPGSRGDRDHKGQVEIGLRDM
jgi:hypothetical protein